MADLDLSQSEADALIALQKVRTSDDEHDLPSLGGKLSLPLQSRDGRDAFMLDIHRGRIDLKKGTYQNRAKQVVPLVRLDFGGPPHTNPDGETIETPHIHVYREGFGDKWAQPLDPDFCDDSEDVMALLRAFFSFCAIVEPPKLREGLWA